MRLTALRQIRRFKDIDQWKLGQIIGTSTKNISNWELGRADPSEESALKIAEVLGCTLDQLCKENFNLILQEK